MSRIQALHSRAARLALPLLPVMVTLGVAAAPAGAQSLAVKLWSDRGDGAVYKPGEPINIAVRANHDANIIVYEIDAEGAVHVLFPSHSNDTSVEGGVTLELPEDPSEQLVVEGPVGEGYIVAIASYEPFRQLPWYLRPHDVRGEEMGYMSADSPEDGVTPEGKIVGDPFVAMEKIRRQVLADPSDTHSFATAYTSYYVHHQVRYPRYLCNDCHRPGYWRWWDGFDPYYSTCSVFEFRVNSGWWWGPTYWTGCVPYYAFVYRTNCPPRYRPHGSYTWWSSWDGWRRWTGTWGGPLRRYKTAPPANYVGPARWERTRTERGANRPLPPGFLASAHERRTNRPLQPGSGIRRERKEGTPPAGSGNGTRPWLRDTGRGAGREAPPERRWRSGSTPAPDGGQGRSERRWGSGAGREAPPERRWGSGSTPAPDGGQGRSERRWGSGSTSAPDAGRGRSRWGERGGDGRPRYERRGESGAQQPNRGDRGERPRSEPSRWSAPREEPAPPAPAPSRGYDRGGQRRERSSDSESPKAPDVTQRRERSSHSESPKAPDEPRVAPQSNPDKNDRPQRGNDPWKAAPERARRG